jgi:hypothetical protein
MQKKKNIGRAFGSCPGDPGAAGERQRTSGAFVARGNGSAAAPLQLTPVARTTRRSALNQRRSIIGLGQS